MALDLYSLLPATIRSRDAESGYVFRDVVYALEQESDSISVLIDGVKDFLSVRNCPSAYLYFLGQMLDTGTFADWSDEKKRVFLLGVVYLYHIKSTRPSLESILFTFGSDFRPIELWKSILHERFDYSEEQDYTHAIRAARIQYRFDEYNDFALGIAVGGLIGNLETFGEDGFLAITDAALFELSLDEDQLEMLRGFYPIHVLERMYGETIEFSNALSELNDVCGVLHSNLVLSEQLVDIDDDGTYVAYSGTDVCGTIGLELRVVTSCESVCQVGAEIPTCETVCQASCQTDCEFSCESPCQGTCEDACMTSEQ